MEKIPGARNAMRGFTLLEILVTVTLIAILAAFAMPQYIRSVENSKAEDAVSLVNMLATTNRMYALDHGNTWTAGKLTNACSAACCPGFGGCLVPAIPPGCSLVACKYLAAGAFDAKPYVFAAADPARPCLTFGNGFIACASRRLSSDVPNVGAATQNPYTSWGYVVNPSGVISRVPNADPNGPPVPTQ